MKRFIAVAGNVGAGKSSLTQLLSDFLCWEPFYEAVNDNPYLPDFYEDMKAWSFHSQIFFLSRRLSHHRQIVERPGTVIQDRSVYEDAEVFATNLHRQGLLDERDYNSYRELYEAVIAVLPPPDLVIYLQASMPTLRARIGARGRDFEQTIADEYLEQLNALYEEWIAGFDLCPVLTVPADDLDFVGQPSHLEIIATKVLDKLHGKDVVVFE